MVIGPALFEALGFQQAREYFNEERPELFLGEVGVNVADTYQVGTFVMAVDF